MLWEHTAKPWWKGGSLVVMATHLFSVSFVLEPKGYATPLQYLPLVCFWKSCHKLKEQEQRRWIKCDISDNLLSFWSPMKTKISKRGLPVLYLPHCNFLLFLINIVIWDTELFKEVNSLLIKMFIYFYKKCDLLHI